MREIARRLDTWRARQGISAAALAVVEDGRVALVAGMGADPTARFPLGSLSSGFTAVLAVDLADEGIFALEDPVRERIPELRLRLRSPSARAAATYADILSHRTGMTGMDVLLRGAPVSREQKVTGPLARAEPWVEFRSRALRNDALFAAVELACERAAGLPFEALLAKRLFEPLGMRSTTSARSTAADMARWMLFLLDRGRAGGRTLIRYTTFDELFVPLSETPAGERFALGFEVAEWEGRRVWTQAGSRERRGGLLALLPDAGVGVVLLADDFHEEIPPSVLDWLWPMLVGEWVAGLEPYVGTYLANFGRFRDAPFTVFIEGGRLMVRIPGETDYRLEWPDKDGLWRYEISDQIALSFERDEEGRVVRMRFHSDGVVLDLPRRGTDPDGAVAREAVKKYLGRYRHPEATRDVRAILHRGTLALDWPDWMVVELVPADENGRFRVRVAPEAEVVFRENDEGEVITLTLFKYGDQVRTLERVGDEAPPGVPGRRALIELRGPSARALEALGAFAIEGAIRRPQAGVDGTFRIVAVDPQRHAFAASYGEYGVESIRIDPRGGTARLGRIGSFELPGSLVEAARRFHPLALFGDLAAGWERIEPVETGTAQGREAVRVELQRRIGEGGATAWIDAETGDLLRFEVTSGPLLSGLPAVWRFDAYREVGGARFPFRWTGADDRLGNVVLELQRVVPVTGGDRLFEEPRAPRLVTAEHRAARGDRRIGVFEKRLAGREAAVPASGRVLVLLPSARYASRTLFDLALDGRSAMDRLALRGYDVFAVDLLGLGRSDAQPARVADLDEAARDLAEAVSLIRTIRAVRSVSLVAVGWGARLAARYAALEPEHVDRLVLHAPEIAPSGSRSRAPGERARDSVREDLVRDGVDPITAEEVAVAVVAASPHAPAVFIDAGEPERPGVRRAIRCPVLLTGPATGDQDAQWYGDLRVRVKERRAIGSGALVPLAPERDEWLDAIDRFLRLPVAGTEELSGRVRSLLESVVESTAVDGIEGWIVLPRGETLAVSAGSVAGDPTVSLRELGRSLRAHFGGDGAPGDLPHEDRELLPLGEDGVHRGRIDPTRGRITAHHPGRHVTIALQASAPRALPSERLAELALRVSATVLEP